MSLHARIDAQSTSVRSASDDSPRPVRAVWLGRELANSLAVRSDDAWSALSALHGASSADLILVGGDATDEAPLFVDPLDLSVALHSRFPGWAYWPVLSATRRHPYNVARSILSAHHLTAGAVGLAISADGDPARTADFARTLRELWNSWPIESIVGDKPSGRYVDTDAIKRIDHGSEHFQVQGPLGTPSGRHGEPILAYWSAAGEPATSIPADAEIVIRPAGELGRDSDLAVESLASVADVRRWSDANPRTSDAWQPPADRNVWRARLGLVDRWLDLSGHVGAFPAASGTSPKASRT